MIAGLRGRLAEQEDGRCVLDVNGVFYLIACSRRTLDALPAQGEETHLYAITEMRENALTLYGFVDAQERMIFRLLTAVQGVGGRVALAILSTLCPHEIANAILAEDRAALVRAEGVGMRLAARLITELRDRIVSLGLSTPSTPNLKKDSQPTQKSVLLEEAISALINLGYSSTEAHTALAPHADMTDLDSLIRAALRDLAR